MHRHTSMGSSTNGVRTFIPHRPQLIRSSADLWLLTSAICRSVDSEEVRPSCRLYLLAPVNAAEFFVTACSAVQHAKAPFIQKLAGSMAVMRKV